MTIDCKDGFEKDLPIRSSNVTTPRLEEIDDGLPEHRHNASYYCTTDYSLIDHYWQASSLPVGIEVHTPPPIGPDHDCSGHYHICPVLAGCGSRIGAIHCPENESVDGIICHFVT